MANTNAQVEAERWIRENELPQMFGQKFKQRSLMLRSKGEFKFDAASDDGKIVAVISTSGGVTSSGKLATAKLQKIRSDAFWFLMLERKPEKSIFVFTEKSMIELINDEKKKGRFPEEFETILVMLPDTLAEKVRQSRLDASEEVKPRKEK